MIRVEGSRPADPTKATEEEKWLKVHIRDVRALKKIIDDGRDQDGGIRFALEILGLLPEGEDNRVSDSDMMPGA